MMIEMERMALVYFIELQKVRLAFFPGNSVFPPFFCGRIALTLLIPDSFYDLDLNFYFNSMLRFSCLVVLE